jgi:hypothetical protein
MGEMLPPIASGDLLLSYQDESLMFASILNRRMPD